MNRCDRPLDPLDAEALASGSDPISASDAAEHSRTCASCAETVSRAAALLSELDRLSGLAAEPADAPPAPADLASGIVRIRPFSRRERRDFSLWRGAVLTAAGFFSGGFLLLLLPGITAREQAGLAFAALAPAAALLRAAIRSLSEITSASPAGLEALGLALRGQWALGAACVAMLLPISWGLARALRRGGAPLAWRRPEVRERAR